MELKKRNSLNGHGASLTWKDISVCIAGAPREDGCILKGISGYALPCTITALMGPSGSGKSTLLDTLAGRLPNASWSGDILVNGRKQQLSFGAAAYVTQQEHLLGTLSVRETITYAANLRLPNSMSRTEKIEVVNKIILDMGLQDCAETKIGNWHIRGISGGQRRRVGIAIEIITRPLLMFLDEPTSGLDSSAAFFVVSTLKNLAKSGRTLIVSIHQPSSEVFELFDNLCLLSGGKTMYFGKANVAKDFFAFAGFPCPPFRNPADHYLRAVNADFDAAEANFTRLQQMEEENDLESQDIQETKDLLVGKSKLEVACKLAEVYQSSEYCLATMEKIQELTQVKGEMLSSKSGAIFLTQALVLTTRSMKNMSRDLGYYWLRIVIYMLLGLAIGTIYYDVGYKYNSIQSRASCLFFIGAFITFMSIGGFPSFIEDIKVFTHERLNGHYSALAFVVANTISSTPFAFLCSFGPSIIVYKMVGLHHGLLHFIYFVLSLYGAITCVEGLSMVVAAVVPNFLMGIISGAGILGFFMLSCGFFRLLGDLPRPFWTYPMSYIAFQRFCLQGMYKNEFIGLEFENKSPSTSKIDGIQVLNDYDIELGRSKWWDFAILLFMALAYRVIFYLIVMFGEAWPRLSSRLFKRNVSHAPSPVITTE